MTIGVKLFYEADLDLVKFWRTAPDGDRSRVLRESLRDYLARLEADPQPATDQDVSHSAARVLDYIAERANTLEAIATEQQQNADQLTRTIAEALAVQLRRADDLSRQVEALTMQLAHLTAQLAAGGGLAFDSTRPAAPPPAVDDTTPKLSDEQAAVRDAKIKQRRW